MKTYYVYLLASKKDGVIYTGVTSDLIKRVYEHKHSLVDGFTKRYYVKRLVYFETFGDIRDALQRERTIKHYTRQWKINLIEKENRSWDDLYEKIAI